MFSDEQPGYYQCNHQRYLTVCCTWHNVAVDTIYNQPIIFKGKTAININKQSSNYTFGHAEVVKMLISRHKSSINLHFCLYYVHWIIWNKAKVANAFLPQDNPQRPVYEQ